MNVINITTTQRLLTHGDLYITLTKKEYLLFEVLTKMHTAADHFIDRRRLVEAVWNERANVIDNNCITQLISRLRKKLLILNGAILFESVYDGGYKTILKNDYKIVWNADIKSKSKKLPAWLMILFSFICGCMFSIFICILKWHLQP